MALQQPGTCPGLTPTFKLHTNSIKRLCQVSATCQSLIFHVITGTICFSSSLVNSVVFSLLSFSCVCYITMMALNNKPSPVLKLNKRYCSMMKLYHRPLHNDENTITNTFQMQKSNNKQQAMMKYNHRHCPRMKLS